jgi:hypothetical protein
MTATSWSSLNQHYLWAAISSLRERLNSEESERAKAPLPRPDWAVNQPPPALETLCRVFRLSDFERGILLLCAAVEMEPTLAQRCAVLQGNPPRPYPTFHLALRYLPNPHWDALAPISPLRHWQLLTVTGEDLLATRPLRIDERILHYLLGIAYLDSQIEGSMLLLSAPDSLPPSQRAVATQIQQQWQQRGEPVPPLINLCGADATSRNDIAAAACQALGVRLYALDAADLPGEIEGRDRFRRRWDREAALSGSALLIYHSASPSDSSSRDQPPALITFLRKLKSRVVISTGEAIAIPQRTLIRLEVPHPSHAEQANLWRDALGSLATKLNGQIGQLVSQFDLEPSRIRQVSAAVTHDVTRDAAATPISAVLWNACRQQARVALENLAQPLEPIACWDDLVLPDPQKRTLEEIVAAVQQRSQVYETWGFSQKSSRGLGISALFAGSSGTGKTMAAEILARALQLDIYRIDLSAVVSKYIGETEKNLRRIFDAAEQGGVILLFDEADALFGKRSDVKDAHDRHANIEVSYLLQRMEAYRGLAILTTNFKNALDTAFLRRLRFVVPFPFPDVAQRLDIWQRVFPPQTPTQDLDYSKLARLTIAGGNIYSIAMNAAFLAAAERSPVQMQHLLRATQSEYAKLEKPLTDTEVRGWM